MEVFATKTFQSVLILDVESEFDIKTTMFYLEILNFRSR